MFFDNFYVDFNSSENDDNYSTDYYYRHVPRPLWLELVIGIASGILGLCILLLMIALLVELVKCCIRRNKRRNSDPDKQAEEATEMQPPVRDSDAAKGTDVWVENLPVPAQPAPAYTVRRWS